MLLGLLDIYMHCYGAGAIHRVSLEGSIHGATSMLNYFYVIRLSGIL
jgi:hypothetical protein